MYLSASAVAVSTSDVTSNRSLVSTVKCSTFTVTFNRQRTNMHRLHHELEALAWQLSLNQFICNNSNNNNTKAQLTPGKHATAVCVWRLVLPSHRCLTPPSWGTPCDINAIYTSLKSAFSGLQFRRWQYGTIVIRLAVIASETREMLRNSERIWLYSSSRSPKCIDLGVNGKPTCDFLLVINCNFGRICYRFRDILA